MSKDSIDNKSEHRQTDVNRDPISGAPGAHPVGVGIGAAAGGAAAGAAAGTVAGPVGTVVGAAVGAVAGGLLGKGIAERIDPTAEDAYWRENYLNEPYYEPGRQYADYEPAYRAGFEVRSRYGEPRTFAEVERDIEAEYNRRRAANGLSWDQARRPARAAWDRVERNVR
jgi:phage tail tape-measure protein